jgi:hypothetical protein
MDELHRQLEKGSIQKAYRALLAYMLGLRTHYANQYGQSGVSGLYQGYMDMTYFAVFPPALKRLDLKIAIVFNYDPFRFEAWLAARNRKIQQRYRELFRDSQWDGYRVIALASKVDAIVECDLAEEFDLDEPAALTARIENISTAFIADMERFLS